MIEFIFRKYFDYDIAVILLNEALNLENSPLAPICVPQSDKPISLVGKMATVIGWGLTDPDNARSASANLRKLNVPILPLQDCEDVATALVTSRNICAGSLNKWRDAAAGDSGGKYLILGSK